MAVFCIKLIHRIFFTYWDYLGNNYQATRRKYLLMFKTILSGYQGIIFDLDGTIIYSQQAWEDAIKKVVSPYIKSSPPYFSEKGINLIDRLNDIKGTNELAYDYDIEKTYHDINREFFNNFEDVMVIPGFEEFVQKLKEDDKKIALATNTDREIATEILHKLNLTSYFDYMFFRQDVDKGKPAPDIYNLAVKEMGFIKERILVFEDSPAGVLAANMAKLKVVVVLDVYNGPVSVADYGSNNRFFIKDYEEVVATMDQDLEDYLAIYT